MISVIIDSLVIFNNFFFNHNVRRFAPFSLIGQRKRKYWTIEMFLFFDCSDRVKSLSMTAVDLCAMYKPWFVQQSVVSNIMEEFWEEVRYSNSRQTSKIEWTIEIILLKNEKFLFRKWRNIYFSFRLRATMKNVAAFSLNRWWIDHWRTNCPKTKWISFELFVCRVIR